MAGLKQFEPSFMFGNNKVAAGEVDEYVYFTVSNPTTSDTYLGTVSSATPSAFVFTNIHFDTPRNVLFTALGVAGGMGGTAVIGGKDQFGGTINETLSFGSAAGGGTVAGTKVFYEVSSGTFTPVGLGGTAVGTAKLGAAIGTAVAVKALFGLPVKIAQVTDVQALTWINNGTPTVINGGTVTSTFVSTANHTFMGTSIVALTDSYRLRIKTTYNSSAEPIWL